MQYHAISGKTSNGKWHLKVHYRKQYGLLFSKFLRIYTIPQFMFEQHFKTKDGRFHSVRICATDSGWRPLFALFSLNLLLDIMFSVTFWDINMKNVKLSSWQYRVWWDCMKSIDQPSVLMQRPFKQQSNVKWLSQQIWARKNNHWHGYMLPKGFDNEVRPLHHCIYRVPKGRAPYTLVLCSTKLWSLKSHNKVLANLRLC